MPAPSSNHPALYRATAWRWRALFFSVLAPATVAAGGIEPRVSALLAREIWLAPEVGQHGPIFLFLDLDGLPWQSHAEVGWNLDTLQLGWDRIRLADGENWSLETGMTLKLELLFAGVYPDFYRNGRRQDERGFLGNYASARTYLKLSVWHNHFVELSTTLRRWFFWRGQGEGGFLPETDPRFVMPSDAWFLEPRLHYTYWNVRGDRSLWERHRLFPRVDGVVLAIQAGFDVRSDAAPWGLDEAGAGTDPRNQPETISPQAMVSFKAGWQLLTLLRTQVAAWWTWSHGADDLNRVRVGAMSPYAIPVPGLPWGAYWSHQTLAAEWSWHMLIWDEFEIGALVDVARVGDPQRTGQGYRYGTLVGISAFADFRYDDWQADLRFGWSPPAAWEGPDHHWSLLAAVGWATPG